MPLAELFPDAELIVTKIIRESPLLPAGVEVATSWQGYEAGESRVVVTRGGGGTATRHRVDSARIDLQTVAPSKAAAVDITQRVRVILTDAPGVVDDGVVVGTFELAGPAYIEDPLSSGPRYVSSWDVRLRPDP